jgi:diguanylate cyclase (GGDEF)-like protein
VFAVPIDACVVPTGGAAGAGACTGEDLTRLDAYRTAEHLAEDTDEPIAVVADGGGVLVLGGPGDSMVMLLSSDALLGAATIAELEAYAEDVDVAISFDTGTPGPMPDNIDSVDGRRLLAASVESPPDAGYVEVEVAVEPQIGITGDGATRYFSLLALGTILLAVAGWTVIAERRRLERRATTDEMTGLLNRREFERQCEEAILNADRFRTGLCIMLLDLDDFKAINDTRGHHVGDQVLIETADRLRDAVRDTDVVGRWGGDEFVILLPGLEQTTAVRNSAERIGTSVGGRPVVDDVIVTGSIGAALYPRHGSTFDELIRAADGAMYGAKTTGVTYRLADSLSGDDPGGSGERYHGPERRRTPSAGEPVA